MKKYRKERKLMHMVNQKHIIIENYVQFECEQRLFLLNEWKWLLELLRVKVLVVDKQLLTTLRFPGNIYTNVTIKNKLLKIGRNSFSFINLMTNKTKYNLEHLLDEGLRDTCKPLNSV